MKSLNILFFLMIFSSQLLFAQSRPITCSSERNSDNSISIYATSDIYGEYTVKLNFISLYGYTASSQVFKNNVLAVVERGKKLILKLTLDKNAMQSSYQYTYTYVPGRYLRKYPDTSFTYLLPAPSGRELRSGHVSSISDLLGLNGTDGYVGTAFYYHLNDTICAARGGIIYDCSEAVKVGEKATQTFSRDRNNIAVQHKDGSIGYYSILSPIRLLVQAGESVYPGQPLAVFNKESEKYTVLLSGYFVDEKKFLAERDAESKKVYTNSIYLPLHFYTGEQSSSMLESNKTYPVIYSKEIIASEMSNKDKKRFGIE